MKKQLATVLASLFAVCCLSGCGKETKQQTSVSETVPTQNVVEAQNETTDGITDEAQKSEIAILVVSFGTSYNDSRDITIGAIETAISDAFPEYDVRRAFTSQIIIDKLKDRDGLEIDNVEEALDRAVEDGVKELVVQPTHLMNGYEYQDLAKALTDYQSKFDKILLADPLLMSDSDFDEVMKAITERTASYDDGKTAICFMGHGTGADSNIIYAKLQEKLTNAEYENYYIGTVESTPSIEDVIVTLNAKGSYQKVVLEPLMVVAGDHANNDMAGDEADSWKKSLENEGYEVECIMEGLGQNPAIQTLYVKHVQNAISSGIAFEGAKEADYEQVSSNILKDGIYTIDVESDSSMFKIINAELTVTDGSMTAVITLSGTGYAKLYMGTAAKAATATEEDFIPYVEDIDGAYTYSIPVAALDQPIDCAAFSKKKEEWYDRKITFLTTSITSDSSIDENSETTATKKSIEDGTYTIEVTLEGGSGKTTVISPATITVSGDNVTASIQFNSPNYDYMLVGGEKYLAVENTEETSVFEIPVTVFDEEMQVVGDTVAMSKPHEIDYTLTFHSDTIKAAK